MSRDKIVMACAVLVLSSLMLTAVPLGAAAEPAPTVLIHEDAEQATYDEWNVRWARGDTNPASGEDSACRTTHNAHESAHGIWMSRNGFNSQYLAPVTMSDGSTGYTQPWNVNITALPSGTPQSQYVMRYDTNQQSIMRKAVVGASSYAAISMTFWFWSDTGASDAKQADGTAVGHDFLNAVYYTGTGAEQVKHVRWTSSEVQASARTWIMITLDLPTDLTAVGFEFISGTQPPAGGDASNAFASSGVKVGGGMREGVYLDDITVTGSQASGDVPVSTTVDDLASVQGGRTFNVGFAANQPTAGFDHVNLYYRQGSSGEWQKYGGDFTSSPIAFTAAGDGRYEFFTQGFDDLGGSEALRNAADAATMVDTGAPATSISVTGTSAGESTYSGSASFTLAASDGGSGVNSTYYRVDSSSWILYSGGVTVSNGGPHTIEYYSIDLAGNREAAKSRALVIETSAPVVTFLEPGKEYDASTATIKYQITTGEAIEEVWASLDGGTNSSVDADLRSITFTDLDAGTHRVTVWARDSSDRWGQNMSVFSVAPGVPDETEDGSISLVLGALDASYRAGDTVGLTWECTSNLTIDHIAVLVDGNVIATLSGDATVYDITGLDAGIHEISVLVVTTNAVTVERSVSISVKAGDPGTLASNGVSQDMLIIGGIALFGLIAAGALVFLRSRKMY